MVTNYEISRVSELRTPHLQVGWNVELQINVEGKTMMLRVMRSNTAIPAKSAATPRMCLTTEDKVRVQMQQVDRFCFKGPEQTLQDYKCGEHYPMYIIVRI